MTLEPKTQEVWCGVRRLDSLVSELRRELNQLRAELSGYSAYKSQLRNVDSFDGLQSALEQVVADRPNISDSRIERFINGLTDNFSDFDSYAGDDTQGALSLLNYDEYRSYLITNGFGEVRADEHIQLLKNLFDPDAAFGDDVSRHESFDTFEQELINNGVSSSDAATVVDLLTSIYPRIGLFDRLVASSDTYDEVQAGLESAGLTTAEAETVIDALKTAYGTALGQSVRNIFSDFDSFDEFKQYLKNEVGLSDDRAARFIEKVKEQFSQFDEFRKLIAEVESIEELISEFDFGSESGSQDIPAGIKVYEESGTDLDGTAMNPGDVSLRAGEKVNVVQLEQTDLDQPEESQVNLEYGPLSLSDSRVTTGETVRASAEVTNANQDDFIVTDIRLLIDNQQLTREIISLGAGNSQNVTFSFALDTAGTFEVAIEKAGPKKLTVGPRAV